MTLEGLGRCLKVILQTCAPENFRLCRWGDERTVKRAQTGSEDPHRRERKLVIVVEALQFWQERAIEGTILKPGALLTRLLYYYVTAN